jgi:hypothetical protein
MRDCETRKRHHPQDLKKLVPNSWTLDLGSAVPAAASFVLVTIRYTLICCPFWNMTQLLLE